MQSRPRPLVVPAFVVPVLVVAGLSLSGCAAGLLGGGVEAGIGQAIGGQPGDESQADDQVGAGSDGMGGMQLPEGWPARVPLPPGELIGSATLGSVMSVSYRLPDVATAEAHVDVIRNAGFTEESSQNYAGNHVWNFTGGDLRVSYHYSLRDSGDSSIMAGIDVVPEQK